MVDEKVVQQQDLINIESTVVSSPKVPPENYDSPSNYSHNALLLQPASPVYGSAKHSLVLTSPVSSQAMIKLSDDECLPRQIDEPNFQFSSDKCDYSPTQPICEMVGEIFCLPPGFKDFSDISPGSTIPYARTPDHDNSILEEMTPPPKICKEVKLPKSIVKPIAVSKNIHVFPSSSATKQLQPSTTHHIYFNRPVKKCNWKFINMGPVDTHALPPKKSKMKSPQNCKFVLEDPEGFMSKNGTKRKRKRNYYYKSYKEISSDEEF